MPEENHAGLLLFVFWVWTDDGLCAGKLDPLQRGRAGTAVFGIADAERKMRAFDALVILFQFCEYTLVNPIGQGVICLELQFEREEISCIKPVLWDVQDLEQTQELRIPEGMPPVGHVLAFWGQPVLRSKEWMRDSLEISAGIQIWGLYQPESGGKPCCLETWIPFRMDWNLPENLPEGVARIVLLPRFVDVRPVSAGKLMIRSGIAALAECWVPEVYETMHPASDMPKEVQLLKRNYPLRLPREAGEKTFSMEESLTLPPSVPQPEKVIYHRLEPEITDRKVLGNKLVFRGNGKLHLLYESEEGQLCSWDFEFPFSQFAPLNGSYSPDAQADILPVVTSSELEQDQDGMLHFRAGICAQYMVDDRMMLEVTEDAYCPGRAVTVQQKELQLPALLDARRDVVSGQAEVSGRMDMMADCTVMPDFPRQRRTEDGLLLEVPGVCQMLWYNEEGSLQSASQRWEGKLPMKMDEEARLYVLPQNTGERHINADGENIRAMIQVPMQLWTMSGQGIPVVTSLTLEEQGQKDPSSPSLILRRANGESLWQIARESGSTMEAIREATGFTGEPENGKMLLIPVV